jgi:uncharacterized integral membrane protein
MTMHQSGPTPTPKRSAGGFRPNPQQIAALVVVVAVLVFFVQNGERREIEFLFFSLTVRSWVADVVILAAGVLIGYVLAGTRRRRKQSAASAKSH